MKKKLMLLILPALFVFFTSNNTFAGGAIKLGVDLPGDHEISGAGLSGTEDVETGFSLSGELFGTIADNIDIGGGITLQLPRSQEDFDGDFYFIPFYGMIRFRHTFDKVAPYLIGQLGYNLFFGDSDYKGIGIFEADLEGGLYYGLGGGVIFSEHFQIELLYSVNNGTAELLGTDFDIEYSKISFLFGYNY